MFFSKSETTEPLNMYHFVVDNDDTHHYIVDHLRPLAGKNVYITLFLFSSEDRNSLIDSDCGPIPETERGVIL